MENDNGKFKIGFSFLFVFLFCVLNLGPQTAAAGSNANFRIQISGLCGNNIKEPGESCDGTDLNGSSCTDTGYAGGDLSCNSNCTFNTSSCVSGGGAGGPVPVPYIIAVTSVIFSGTAYPSSVVTLLEDGQIVATATAYQDANFYIRVSGLSGGNYVFSAYSEDGNGNRSSLLTFPTGTVYGATTNVSGIAIAPTITADKSEVQSGGKITISGQTAPNGEITISITSDNSNKEILKKITADVHGVYSYGLDTTGFGSGTYYVKSKALIGNAETSAWSNVINFKIGAKNTAVVPSVGCAAVKTDLNGDCRVNLVDFSIAAYWFERSSPPARIDFNGDGKIDLVDFSIMAFQWTG